MKAALVKDLKGSSSFEVKDIPNPTEKDGQVLVEVKAASINPFDLKWLSGAYGDMGIKAPFVGGGDLSGVVRQTGEEIFGSAVVLNGGSGAYAEFAAINIKNSSAKPKKASFEEASALVLVGSSAVQAIEEHLKLKPEQKILIHGGAGGIGHIAIQIAKAIGAFVATTVSADDLDFAKSLGADKVIDYKKEDFSQILTDYDAVFDTVGQKTWEGSFKILKDGGVFVSMLGDPKSGSLNKNITTIGQGTKTTTEHLSRVAQYFDDGKIKVNIDKTFLLNQISQAFEYQENKSPKGKVVIKIS